MLPSFRLIVATFLCGFAAVYGGLHVAMSLNEAPGALPATAHAGLHVLPTADGDARVASIPALFDARFAIAPAVQVRATPSVMERPSLPLSVVSPQSTPAADAIPMTTTEPEPSNKSEDVVATAPPQPQPAPPIPPADETADRTVSPDAPPPADLQP